MKIDSVVKFIKAIKPNQVTLIGGSLITGGVGGFTSPFWFPLIEDVTRTSLNLASNSSHYSVSPFTLSVSTVSIVLGMILILVNRFFEHKEHVLNKMVELDIQRKPSAFEAESGGEVIIKDGRIKNYESVAKASNKGIVQMFDSDVEK